MYVTSTRQHGNWSSVKMRLPSYRKHSVICKFISFKNVNMSSACLLKMTDWRFLMSIFIGRLSH